MLCVLMCTLKKVPAPYIAKTCIRRATKVLSWECDAHFLISSINSNDLPKTWAHKKGSTHLRTKYYENISSYLKDDSMLLHTLSRWYRSQRQNKNQMNFYNVCNFLCHFGKTFAKAIRIMRKTQLRTCF